MTYFHLCIQPFNIRLFSKDSHFSCCPLKQEQASDHVASTVQTCMKQYGVMIEEANEKLRVKIEEAWMDIVEECLEQKRPMALLETAVNVARIVDSCTSVKTHSPSHSASRTL